MRELATWSARIRRNLSTIRRMAHTFVNRLTERARKRLEIRHERVNTLSREIHWSCRYHWLASREQATVEVEQRQDFFPNLNLRCNLPVTPVGFFGILLEGRAALNFRGKPFSLHLLNQGRSVHLEHLRRLARNPVGLSKRANDQTVLELFDLS